jgi:GNAT superfamily N-acetyltransferase
VNAERAEAAFWAAFLRNRNVDSSSAADGAVAVAGGYALCALGTYLEYAIGAGSTRPLRGDDLEIVRDFYGRRGLPPRLELDEEVLARDAEVLRAANFEEEDEELSVLEAEAAAVVANGPFAIRAVTDRRGWADLVVRAFADTIDAGERPRLLKAAQASAASAHALFIASLDGTDVGAGAVAITGEHALLYSAAVLPAFRRRGAHRALVTARLAFAHGRGALRAAVKVLHDSAAERSAQALGFTQIARRRRVRGA